jgi:1,2-diacylglycerol 3-beta-glucosyltransferase
MNFGRLVRSVPTVVALPAAVCGGYVGFLTLASRRHRPSTATDRSVRFVIVVPAHNEAFGITDTIVSLRAVDYPRHAFRVVVIADNCTDDTAAVARAAGAQVIERTDDGRRSKGFALSDVLPQVLDDPWADAVMVVDADSIVSANVLALAAGRIAAGEHALQIRYGVRNTDDSWRTRLLSIAFACFHDLRSAGREELGLSCGLRGNGMVFTRHALTVAPHRAASLVEDLEHGLDLADVGIRVAYVGGASVLAEMPNNEDGAGSQRDRWEQGRAQFRPRALATLRKGLRSADRVRVDLAMDVLVPPLGTVAMLCVGSMSTAMLASTLRRRTDFSVIPAAVGVGGLAVHVVEGWRISGTGRHGLSALGHVPGYVFWKMARRNAAKATATDPASADAGAWVRTARNHEVASPDWASGSSGQTPMNSSDEECAS